MTKIKIQTSPLEVKYEELEQYDYSSDDDVMFRKQDQYSSCIGLFLIWFSNLEHSLDIELANLINDRSHDEGYVVIKDLEMFEKIELFYNLAFPRVHFSNKRKSQKMKSLILIYKKLDDLTILRNRIAHGKWNTLDKEGFIRVDAKTNKENGLIKFRKYKITPKIMRKGVTEIKALVDNLSLFVERLWV